MKAKSKVSLIITTVTLLSIYGINLYSNTNNTAALEYTTNYGVNFTLRPSINVSLSSSDLVITDLLPNTSSDSNVITINVASNNSTGYVLNSSVGSNSITGTNNTSYNNRNLTNTAANNYTFTSLDYGSSVSDMSSEDVDPNTWGYSYATYNTSTSDYNAWSNYSGLPLYSDTTNIATLKTTNTTSLATGDNIRFKIAAKASSTQGSGEYTNIINFIAVGNPTPVSFYDAFSEAASQPGSTISQLNGYYKMQDMSAEICNAVSLYDDASHIQLIDTRDNEIYWIGKLKDDRCWLLDNLRLGSNDYPIELTPQDTNIEEAWTLPRGITSGFGSYTMAQINAAYKNTTTTSYGLGSGKVGAYYNYCAASGGTYCYDENSGIGNAEYDVCPANWKSPTGGTNGEYISLFWASNNDSAIFRNSLSTPLSGRYFQATQAFLNTYGYFWSSTYYGAGSMLDLVVSSSGVDYYRGFNTREVGNSIRCIANNQ